VRIITKRLFAISPGFRCIQFNGCSSSSHSTTRVETSKDILHNAFLV